MIEKALSAGEDYKAADYIEQAAKEMGGVYSADERRAPSFRRRSGPPIRGSDTRITPAAFTRRCAQSCGGLGHGLQCVELNRFDTALDRRLLQVMADEVEAGGLRRTSR